MLDFLSIDLVIDVGGNAGQYHDMLRGDAGFKGQIVTFEPVPHLASHLLQRSASDPLWEVRECAVGATRGTADFHVMAQTEFSSFLKPSHTDLAIFTDSNVVTATVAVKVTTLDDELPGLLAQYRPKAVYLKMDAQGFELEILKGASATLQQISAFQSEVAFRKIYEGAPDYKAIIEYAAEHDLLVSGLFRNNEEHFPFIVDFDCFFVRRDQVAHLPVAA